jgi:hypothetical protein
MYCSWNYIGKLEQHFTRVVAFGWAIRTSHFNFRPQLHAQYFDNALVICTVKKVYWFHGKNDTFFTLYSIVLSVTVRLHVSIFVCLSAIYCFFRSDICMYYIFKKSPFLSLDLSSLWVAWQVEALSMHVLATQFVFNSPESINKCPMAGLFFCEVHEWGNLHS